LALELGLVDLLLESALVDFVVDFVVDDDALPLESDELESLLLEALAVRFEGPE